MKRRSKSAPEPFYFVDLFAGAGGLSKGLELAGMECALGVDFDHAAMRTFVRNHKKSAVYDGDIAELTEKRMREMLKGKKIRLVCGGPPCQGMSTVGRGDPKDPRNFLFKEFVRVVRELKPDYILLENVTGMVGKKNHYIVAGIAQEFMNLGYALEAKVLTASQYGVPERRRRTIFLGNRLGYAVRWPKPVYDGAGLKHPKTVGDAFKNLRAKNGVIYNHDVSLAKVSNEKDVQRLKHIPEGCGIRYQEDEKKHLPKEHHLGVDWKKMDEGRFRQTKYQRLDRKKPSPTIMTGSTSYYHPVEDRFLTVREAASIQSFPNNFIFEGSVSQCWRQIGNAVPCLMAKALGKSILKTDKLQERSKKTNLEVDVIRSRAFYYKYIDDPAQQVLTTRA